MKRTMRLASCALLCALAEAGAAGEWRLWYEQPAPLDARGWERESLPLGNGWFGVSVFGGVTREQLPFTEPTFLTRRAHRSGSFPGNLTDAFDAWIETAHVAPTNYVRWLDLEDALAGVAYTSGGVRFTRECFASYPDRVFAMRLTADRAGALAFTLRGEIPFAELFASDGGSGPFGRRGTVTAGGNRIDLREEAEAFGCRLFAQFRIETDGAVVASSNALSVTQATTATVLVSMGTNYRLCPETFRTQRACGVLDEAAVEARLDAASRKGYAALKAAHVADYRALALRSEIRLAHDPADAAVPTDVLRSQKARTSAYLHQLYWRYGKYLLVSASRPGTLPASLQGVWAGPLKETPWGSGYWYNINVQMNYWPAFSCNLAECFRALADFNAAWQPATRDEAVAYLRRHVPAHAPSADEAQGLWSVGTAVYPYTVEGAPGGHSGPGTIGLTTRLYGDWWAFTRDRAALERHVWPTLRGAAEFLQRCVVETNGLWLAKFSASPEQRVQRGQERWGEPGTYFHGLGCAFDQQMLHENARDLIAVARELGREDDPVVRTARAQMVRYDPVILGASGQVKEFREETNYGDIGERRHRHISQLCGLMPGTQITASTPAWLAAARRTLDLRGDKSTGWALAHRLCARARCGDGERAYALLGNLLADRTNANLWDMHPPFQIDGNFGATAGIVEMLLQSHETTADGKAVIRLLPALPEAWAKAGEVRGLCARGGYTVSFAWRDGRVVSSSVVGLPDSPGYVLKENSSRSIVTKGTSPSLPKPWMPDPKTLPQNVGRTLTFDRPLPRQWLVGAGEKAAPGERNRQIGTYNNGELAYPGLLSTAGSAFGEMMADLRRVVWADRRLVFIDGRVLMCQLNWIRDHVHQSKAFCHWEHDMTSFLDFILDTQRADGQFFELIKQWTDYHWTKVNPDCVRLYPDDAQTLVRLELEADVEYLMVEGCLQAWRTTGDDAWLKRALPRLEKGIDYQTSDPKRWDAERGLCKRPYTIDTWDFLAIAGGGDRRVNLDGPMAVMHGDNTGVYQAMRQLAFVNRRFGNEAKARDWERRAAELKANVMKHLYNGRFFVHQLPLNCPPVDEHEAERLTLSDAYALNRGIWTPEENRRCIEEYMRRRKTVDAFAEWYTIDPPIANACHKPGEYVNGAVSPFTAGELAKGAFENGYEAYGYDILRRVRELVARDGGKLYFLYNPKTREAQGRGPSAWGAAAILSAIDQGLAGVQDTDKLYRTMRFAPRWAVTEHREGRYLTGYEISKKKIDVRWTFKESGFRYRLECPSERVDAHLLVPAGRTPKTLKVNGRETPFALVDVFGSTYVDVTVAPENGLADFEVFY